MRLVGFVVPDKDGDGWYLARISIACCAADGSPTKVFVRSTSRQVPPRGRWVAVEGRGLSTLSAEHHGRAVAEVEAERVTQVPPPAQPYE